MTPLYIQVENTMKKLSIIILLSFFLFSCGNKEVQEKNSTQSASESTELPEKEESKTPEEISAAYPFDLPYVCKNKKELWGDSYSIEILYVHPEEEKIVITNITEPSQEAWRGDIEMHSRDHFYIGKTKWIREVIMKIDFHSFQKAAGENAYDISLALEATNCRELENLEVFTVDETNLKNLDA